MAESIRSLYLKGIVLSALGMLLLSPDALATRSLIATDAWAVAFWRALFLGSSILLVLAVLKRRSFVGLIRSLGWCGLAAGACLATANATFVGAIVQTSAANTLIILAATPFFGAVLGRLLIAEAVPGRTWAAIAAAFVGVTVTVSGSLGTGSWIGDCSALAAALAQAAALVFLRGADHERIFAALGISGWIGALALLPIAYPVTVGDGDFILLAAVGLVMLPIAFGLFLSGVRWVPAAEVALLAMIETVLGPILVWIGIGETPTLHAFLGGAIVLGAIAINAILGFWKDAGATGYS